jgi:hypothetical protein
MRKKRSKKLTSGRDSTLLGWLPKEDSPYSFNSLDKSETAALEAALGDGFGDIGSPGFEPSELPGEVDTGLLRYSFFVPSENDAEEHQQPFWHTVGDRPAAFESFPLGFVRRRLRLYFLNQLNRFCKHFVGAEAEYASLEREEIEALASYRLFEKPWYEYHAVQFLDWIENVQPGGRQRSDVSPALERSALSPVLISSFSGQLGRLVEQYYWRFRFEKALVRIRTGASEGGKAKSQLSKAKQTAWRSLASQIWKRRPELSGIAVAEAVKKQLNTAQSAKHIVRYIRRPQ